MSTQPYDRFPEEPQPFNWETDDPSLGLEASETDVSTPQSTYLQTRRTLELAAWTAAGTSIMAFHIGYDKESHYLNPAGYYFAFGCVALAGVCAAVQTSLKPEWFTHSDEAFKHQNTIDSIADTTTPPTSNGEAEPPADTKEPYASRLYGSQAQFNEFYAGR